MRVYSYVFTYSIAIMLTIIFYLHSFICWLIAIKYLYIKGCQFHFILVTLCSTFLIFYEFFEPLDKFSWNYRNHNTYNPEI